MDPDTQQSTGSYFLSWRYLLFWVSSLLSNMGSWMQEVVQPWLVLSLSGSAFWVGFTSFAANIAALLFTLPGGIVADYYDRKKVTLFFQGIQFLVVLAMLVALIGGLLKVWMVIVVAFIVGVTDSLCNPSLQTIVPSLVAHKDIQRAVALSSTQFNLSRILGPVIAGIVIVRFGAVACFSANAISYIPFFVAIWFIYPGKKAREPLAVQLPDQLGEIKTLIRVQGVRMPLLTIFIANFFCGPLVTFCSVLVRDVFHSGVGNFGWAMTAFGAGALAGAFFSFIPVSFGRNRLTTSIAVMQGFLIMAIAVNRSLVLFILLLILAGAAQITVNISMNAFLQENAADELRGRVVSLYQMALFSGVALGALLTGFMVSKFGIGTALFVNGALAAVFQVSLLWWKVKLRAGNANRIDLKK